MLWRLLLWLQLPGALLASMLFAVHPVHVESVAWITERKNTLSLLFYLLATHCYIRFDQTTFARMTDAPTSSPRQLRWYMGSLFCFIGALLSKSVTCSLPAALMLLVYWRRGTLRVRDILPLVPFFVLGLIAGWNTSRLESDHVMQGQDQLFGWTFAERCLIAGQAIWFYLGKLAWPYPLAFTYTKWSLDASSWYQWMFPTAAVALIGILYGLKDRWGRGPLVAALFFGGTLFPALGFIDVYPHRFSFVADHFQYHATLAPIVLFSAVLTLLTKRMSERLKLVGRYHVQFQLAPFLLLIPLGILTWNQCYIYKNKTALWRDTIVKNPTGALPRTNLAVILINEDEFHAALKHLAVAEKSDPNLYEVSYYQGISYAGLGNYEMALQEFDGLLEIIDPNFDVLIRAGKAATNLQDFDVAADYYLKAARLEPKSSRAWEEAGLATLKSSGPVAAIRVTQEALQELPRHAMLWSNIGVMYAQTGHLNQAIQSFKQAARLQSENENFRRNLEQALRFKQQETNQPAIKPDC